MPVPIPGKDWSMSLQDIRCYVLDMDGTIYLSNRLFDFTKGFLDYLTGSGRRYCFFTNNSSRNAEFYCQKLANMGIVIEPSQMLISNQVMIRYLKEQTDYRRLYVLGTPYLLEDFEKAGFVLDAEKPDAVILGFDMTLNYEKLTIACTHVRNGVPFLGVNPDFNCPTDTGFLPDCGSMAKLITASTRVVPEFFGKPSKHTLHYIIEQVGLPPSQIAIVGDRLYTDIAVGQDSELSTILVLSGETTREDLAKSDIQPDYVFEDLSALQRELDGLG